MFSVQLSVLRLSEKEKYDTRFALQYSLLSRSNVAIRKKTVNVSETLCLHLCLHRI